MPELPLCSLCGKPIDLKAETYVADKISKRREDALGIPQKRYYHRACKRKDLGLPETPICEVCRNVIDEDAENYVVKNKDPERMELWEYVHARCLGSGVKEPKA